jgi:hypothetical protein
MIGSILLALISNPASINVIQIDDSYYLLFQDLFLASIFIFYSIIVFLITWSVHLRNYSKIRDKELAFMMSIIVLLFTVSILTYVPYFFIHNIFFKNLHLFIYIFTGFFILYAIIKKPYLFIALTNQVFDFIVFHRSGILLYSYNMETGEETEDPLIKGTILIGINHILSHFKQKEEVLNLIRIKDRDIILEYDKEHGYAVLLTVNKSNKIIIKSIRSFMKDFTERFKDTLDKINKFSQIIDVSVFKNAKDLLVEHFLPYLKN